MHLPGGCGVPAHWLAPLQWVTSSLSFPQTGAGVTECPLPGKRGPGRAGGVSRVPWLCFPLSPRRQSRVAGRAAGGLISNSQHFPRRACGSRRATDFQRRGREPRPGQQEGSLAVRPHALATSRQPRECNRAAAGISRRFRPGGRRPLRLFLRGRRRVGSGRRASGSRWPWASGGRRAGGVEEVTVAETYLFGGRRTDTRWPGWRKTKGGCLLLKGRKWSSTGDGETYWDWAGAFLS